MGNVKTNSYVLYMYIPYNELFIIANVFATCVSICFDMFQYTYRNEKQKQFSMPITELSAVVVFNRRFI